MSTGRYSGEKCLIIGNPHNGEEATLLRYMRLTKCWDVALASGLKTAVAQKRLQPIKITDVAGGAIGV